MITYMQRMYFILIAYLLLGYYDSYAQPYLLKHLGVEDWPIQQLCDQYHTR